MILLQLRGDILMLRTLALKIYNNSKLGRFCWLKYVWFRAKRNMKTSDEEFTKKEYFKRFGKHLNLEDPETYDEKLSWLKLHNRDPLLTVCSDKYKVRDYVKECGLGKSLTKVYGVYDDANEVDFSIFDKPVFLKCNHTSGDNCIYYPDEQFDRKEFIRTFNFILKQNYYYQYREWNYKDIKPKIMAEEVLLNEDGSLPVDYKFLCMNGEPKLLFLFIGTCDEHGRHAKKENRYLNVYDMEFNLTNINSGGYGSYKEKKIEKPLLFDQMKEYSKILSGPFDYCRVDLYEVQGKIYFGEITFYDNGGFNSLQPIETELLLGSWININCK